eukprot:TRINITY_DN1637_c0_g3_i2.p1 TRINITY_DN1637_c0_g3~~TRINITY_DN1637_c0_g3_i2.p1  ORF type:complete len:405 (-),score=108.20 TRINITY_DN1637_c0_g3_i2:83-1261(-)
MAVRLRRRLAQVACVLCAAAFWDPPLGVHAWDKDGHEAVGMTCMSALQPEATAQVKHLMHGRDASDVAAWAHKVNKKFPWTVALHFQKQPNLRCNGADLSVCPGNRCLVTAMKYFYNKLTDQPTVDIDWGAGIKLTDADHVKYLINLIGDLHQPLHFVLDSKVDARNLTVTFRGKKTTMFDLWDSQLTQEVMRESPGFWLGGWTNVQRAMPDFVRDSRLWQQNGALEFDRWANESADFLCHNVYRSTFDESDALPAMQAGTFRLSESEYQVWKRAMLTKILEAGYRVAIVLNAVLQHREGKHEMHAGSAVRGVDEAEEGDRDAESLHQVINGHMAKIHPGGHSVQGFQAFGYNLLIFGAVSVIFLQVMRTWRGKDVVSQADRLKSSGTGKII